MCRSHTEKKILSHRFLKVLCRGQILVIFCAASQNSLRTTVLSHGLYHWFPLITKHKDKLTISRFMELLGKEFFVIFLETSINIKYLKRGTNFPKRCPKFNKFLAFLSTFRHQPVLHIYLRSYWWDIAKHTHRPNFVIDGTFAIFKPK